MTTESALRELRNAVHDLWSSDYDNYARLLKRIAKILASNDLKFFVDKLKAEVDFDDFIAESITRGGRISNAKLNWPIDKDQELGLCIVLIERGADDPDWFEKFAFNFYYSGTKIFESIEKLVRSVVIPFERDLAIYVEENVPSTDHKKSEPMDFQRVFIVHGHDEGPSAMVARFISDIGLEPVILHEQPDQGMTIIEKLEANSNVGYAIVILTPDDLGRSKTERVEEEKSRARQNVILELGYFLSHLGRDKVIALRKDKVQIPSDYMGVLYTPFDDARAWHLKLAKEMETAGYDIDWSKVKV